MDCLKLLVIFIVSAATVTSFQVSSSLDGSKSDDLFKNGRVAIPSRNRRDVNHELARNAQKCCNAPKSPMEDNGKKKECMQEVGSKFSVTVTEELLFSDMASNVTTCFAECMLRKGNALDNGGKVILKAALDAIQDCPGFKDQSVLDKVATTCANLPEANGGGLGETYICNPAAMQFMQCAHDIRAFNCPVEYQMQSATCAKVWEEVNAKKQ
jgi:hypothetical protein